MSESAGAAPTPEVAGPKPSLGQRAAKSSFWSVAGFGMSNAIRLASNLVLTRLLAPEAFGVMAITSVVLTWLNMLSDFGIKPSLIRSPHGDDPAFQATARTIQLGRGIGLALLLLVASGVLVGGRQLGAFPADSVYADPRLPHFLQIMGAGVVAQGLTSIRSVTMERNLSLLPIVRLELITQVFGICVIIGLALLGFGAYSLALGTALGMVARTLGSYWLIKGAAPGFGLRKEYFREIIGYGKWLILASFFGFFVNRGGSLILGYLVDQNAFSLFAIGSMWVATARTLIQQLIQKVGYPMFSEISRERPQDTTRVYYRIRTMLDAAVIVVFLLAYFLSGPVFDLLYTEQYQGVAHFVRLCAVSLVLLPYNLLNTVLLSSGDSKKFTVVTFVPAAGIAVGTPLAYSLVGMEASVIFVSLVQVFSLPFIWKFGSKVVQLRPLREAVPLIVAGIVSVFLVGVPG